MMKWSSKYEDYLNDEDAVQETFTTNYQYYINNSSLFFTSYVFSGYVRPPKLTSIIDLAFNQLVQRGDGRSYIYTGSSDYSIPHSNLYLSCSNILAKKISALADNQVISVLDVGAGNFDFSEHHQKKYNQKVKMYGIAATNAFISKKKVINEEFQVFKNAEYLSTIFQNIEFDYIFSKATYMHFVDPVGSIIEAYKILKPGGILIIDKFFIRGCEDYLEKIIIFLREQGYLILAQENLTDTPPSINGFIIQKPKNNSLSELKFPVLYKKIVSGEVYYRPHPDLLQLKIDKTLKTNIYEEKKKAIWKYAETLNSSLLHRHARNSFPSLFSDSEYLFLHKTHKLLFVMALVSKETDYHQHETLLKELNQYDNSIMMNNFLLNTAENGNVYQIENELIFKACSKIIKKKLFNHEKAYAAQLNMIKYTVMSNILKKIETKEAKNILKQFDLPYKVEEKLGTKRSLQFSELTTYWQNNLNFEDNITQRKISTPTRNLL